MNHTRAHGRPSPMAGFSLTETLVVLALVGILLGLAVPGMGALRVRQQLQSVAEDVWSSLMLARSQAMVQQERVVLCPAASATACDAQKRWDQGWLLFVDRNHNDSRDADEPVLQSRGALPAGVLLQGNSTVHGGVRYGPEGLGQGLSGTLTVCKPGVPEQWKVVINSLGRPRMDKLDAADCP